MRGPLEAFGLREERQPTENFGRHSNFPKEDLRNRRRDP
jgi:hypothetical protein